MQTVTDIYPNAEVRVSRAQFSVLHVKRMVEERRELLINPDFQRRHVWSRKQNVELIESILMGIPIPAIYLFESNDGTKQVVDGQQRITAVISFINNAFALKNLKILPQFDGKRFCELDGKMQGIIEDFQLYFYIIQPPTPERVKYDIFDRVNRGGTTLNSQEMRNALYRGNATTLIQELSESKAFLSSTDGSISPSRLKDQMVVLRAVAFYMFFSNSISSENTNKELFVYKSDIDDFLAKIMVYLNEVSTESQIEELKGKLIYSMQAIYAVLGPGAGRFVSVTNRRRPISTPLYEMLVFIFSFPSVVNNPEKAKRVVNCFKTKHSSSVYFRNNVDSSAMVAWRFNSAKSIIEEIIND